MRDYRLAADDEPHGGKGFSVLVDSEPSPQEKQIQELQARLVYERDARLEERFLFIVVSVLLLDVVFFTIMPTFGGPIALLILELLILIPLAKRMGMEEIARILGRVLDRMATKGNDGS